MELTGGKSFMGDTQYLVVEHLHKSFGENGDKLQVLRDISLTVKKGEFVCIVGGSGCGKSTLLRAIAGLDPHYEGTVQIDGQDIHAPSKERGMIFQEHRLFPWLTVEDNIAYALNGVPADEKKRRAQQYLELVGLKGFEKAYPKQLSGGMAQRTSIARALVNNPKLLLLDEPFGALDAFTKIQMQKELLNIKREAGSTMILVTHDIEEAVYLADRVIVFSPRPGTIRRIVPVELPYPRNRNQYEFVEIRKKIYNEFFEDATQAEDYII